MVRCDAEQQRRADAAARGGACLPRHPRLRSLPYGRASVTRTTFATRCLPERMASVNRVRVKLAKQFEANVATPPLPAPYVIDLTVQEQPSAKRARDFTIVTHIAHADQGPDTARIALLDCPMPETAYSHLRTELYVYDRERGSGADAAEFTALAAVDAAHEQGAQLLVMPEVFLPRGSIDDVVERARTYEMGVIAGAEYPHQPLGGAINEAIIALPELGEPLLQRKQAPSVYEARRAHFEHDDLLHVFRRTPFGTLAVVICSDCLEFDHVWSVANQPHALDLLIVCSRNPRPEVLNRLAVADAVRLHAYVAIANADPRSPLPEGATAGTIVAQPNATEPLLTLDEFPLPAAPDDGPAARLMVAELDVAALRRRDLERTGNGPLLPPPRFPRWQPTTDLAARAG